MNPSPPLRNDSLLVTVEEAAKVLRISRSKMFTLLASGSIKGVHMGPRCLRISKQEIKRFILDNEK